MIYFNSKMKLVFIVYQAVLHSCRYQYAYHNQYSDYESQYNYIQNPVRRAQKNLLTRYVTVHRPPDRPHDIGRSYTVKSGNYSDQNIVVVPYPVPVLIFPINKPKSDDNNTQTSDDKTNDANQSTKNNTKHDARKLAEKLKKTHEKIYDSSLRPDDSSQKADKSETTTLESEVQTRKITETETQKLVEKILQPTEKAPTSTEKIESAQKIYEDDQESIEAALDLEGISDIIYEVTDTKKQKNDAQNHTPVLAESNIKQTQAEATLTYRPQYSNAKRLTYRPVNTNAETLTYRPLNSNSKYNMFHRDKGPPRPGVRQTKGPPLQAQGIRLRPTIARTNLKASTKTDTKQIRRRRFKMPKFGLVHIPNDLAKKLRLQLSQIDNRNVI